MGRYRRYPAITPITQPTPGPLTIPNDFITSEMIKSNAILGHHIKNEVIGLEKLDSFAIEEIHSWITGQNITVDSDDIVPGAIDFNHLSDDARTHMTFPYFTDYFAHQGTIQISKNMGKTFISFGDTFMGRQAALITITLIPPMGSSSGATLKVYGGGVYNEVTKAYVNGKGEAVCRAGRHVALSNGFNIPVFGELSLIHNPVQGDNWPGVVLEITEADDNAKLFTVEVRPYGYFEKPTIYEMG